VYVAHGIQALARRGNSAAPREYKVLRWWFRMIGMRAEIARGSRPVRSEGINLPLDLFEGRARWRDKQASILAPGVAGGQSSRLPGCPAFQPDFEL
jgi:hypothetical protein